MIKGDGMTTKWKIWKWEFDKEDIRSFSRYFLAVALIIWAYNLGYNDAMRTVDYVNMVCGPGSALQVGHVAEIYVYPMHNTLTDINIHDTNIHNVANR